MSLGRCLDDPIGLAAYKNYWNSSLNITYKNQEWDYKWSKIIFLGTLKRLGKLASNGMEWKVSAVLNVNFEQYFLKHTGKSTLRVQELWTQPIPVKWQSTQVSRKAHTQSLY